MEEIAPGSILQRMHFKNRLSKIKAGKFCEIGCGNGYLSRILLEHGWTGVGYDLGESACENSRDLNAEFVSAGKYSVIHGDFLKAEVKEKFDFILSMMVIEHLSPADVKLYFEKCKNALSPNGTITVFVPSGMKFWGVEDDIAGHFKRYEFEDFKKMASEYNLEIKDLSGLTYPVSNLLLGLSNILVHKNEGGKKELSLQERTIQSGNRGVKFKTAFPFYMKLILNEYVMFPFHVLQKMFSSSKNSMVIYCEMSLKK